MASRLSTYSSSSLMGPAATGFGPRSTAQQSSQTSTTTLLNTLHTAYTSACPYSLDAGTSLVVNTWLGASGSGSGSGSSGGGVDGGLTVDPDIARKVWEHARRRAEDGCIVLGSLHDSAPSVLLPFVSTLPFPVPSSVFTALSVLRAFTCHVTPFNASFARHSALAVTFNLSLAGPLDGASVALSTSGIDTVRGLTNLPAEPGYRAFDVFYYLLTSASTPAEREFLGLTDPTAYTLLNRTATYNPPAYLPAADDAAAADDFRNSLKSIGIRGSTHRNLLSVLAGLLKLGNALGFLIDAEELDEACDEVAGLLGLDPEVLTRKCTTDDRAVLLGGLYECLVDWVVLKANEAIRSEVAASKTHRHDRTSGDGDTPPSSGSEQADVVSISVVEVPDQNLGRAVALRGIFDDTIGINREMKDDGVEVIPAGSSVLKETTNAVNEVAADLGIQSGPIARDREHELDRREGVLEKVGVEAEDGAFLKTILYPVEGQGIAVGKHGRFDLPMTLSSSRVWYHLALHPTDDSPAKLASALSSTTALPWSAGAVSRQLRAWRLPEWANRRHKNLDFTADFDIDEFVNRYKRLGCQDGRDGAENWILERGWSNGEAVVGHERVWIHEGAWWEAEGMLDLKPEPAPSPSSLPFSPPTDFMPGEATGYSNGGGSGFFPPMAVGEELDPSGSRDNLLTRSSSFGDAMNYNNNNNNNNNKSVMGDGRARSVAPTLARTMNTMPGDYGLGAKGDDKRQYEGEYDAHLDPEMGEPAEIKTTRVTWGRRAWVAFAWALTFWIPSPLLRYVGRMRRPDVRMAWREKIALVFLILLLNGIVVFYIIEFGLLLCPGFDKAWNAQEVATHQGDDDFYVSVRGKVYDISSFLEDSGHSDVVSLPVTKADMEQFAGQDLDNLFPPPLSTACHAFVTDVTIALTANNTPADPAAIHTSGPRSQYVKSKLYDINWYPSVFLPKMQTFYKGDLVWDVGNVTAQGKGEPPREWVIINGRVYDLTDYFNTVDKMPNLPQYDWLPQEVTELIRTSAGQDITGKWGKSANFTNSMNCMENVFFKGITDFRETPRCQVNNYILLAFTIIICVVILTKFLAALQFGSKSRPAPQDKFVICQVPAYTEGEDQLRKGLDSLTALAYDNKRKLICVICDGMIVGGGNDRPTPKIVLDVLGVDPKIDPPALPFRSVGQGADQLNYGKVYSGLYEHEGNVVPYVVVVKVGKESEQTRPKPGNRGKRDSQVLLMSFLNRVHHRAPMNPLELEIFHQVNNIIGVDPELYEYLFMVDADTSVREDSLNRLVASCANDAKIAGICGETSLQNEERSWWTMIQVYEYYISHHLAKAFESLFGSVTCLPGCFCMYRLRTADKGRPLIISDKIIDEYSDGDVDTLHKKNLLSLGEDRYLTTLMTKHFPQMSYKFIPDAYASTAAPETWSVLLSQRRRWINSTVHNLAELVFLKDLCGFCCFSMRFVVFIDLFGTIILPATCTYIGYLIYRVATHSGQFPIFSIAIIGAVYGLQALIFILKRQWQHVGWMIIYILAYPVYSLILPLYSFWKQDDFSWGTTRIVIGDKDKKHVLITAADEGFDPRSIPLQRWDDYAASNGLPGRRSGGSSGGGAAAEKSYSDNAPGYHDNVNNNPGGYELDDMRSMYSSVRPASTVLTGFKSHNYNNLAGADGGPTTTTMGGAYMTPIMSPTSPGFGGNNNNNNINVGANVRHSTMTSLTRYTDAPQYAPRSGGGAGEDAASMHRSSTMPVGAAMAMAQSRESLLFIGGGGGNRTRSPQHQLLGRRESTIVDFRNGPGPLHGGGPDEAAIADAVRGCLAEADLDTVTKKQIRVLVEQRLQTEITGEKRTFLDRQIDAELANM